MPRDEVAQSKVWGPCHRPQLPACLAPLLPSLMGPSHWVPAAAPSSCPCLSIIPDPVSLCVCVGESALHPPCVPRVSVPFIP